MLDERQHAVMHWNSGMMDDGMEGFQMITMMG